MPKWHILAQDEDAGALDVVMGKGGVEAGAVVDVIEAVGEVRGDLRERRCWRSRKDSGLVPSVSVFFSAMDTLEVAASLPCASNATAEHIKSNSTKGGNKIDIFERNFDKRKVIERKSD